MINFSIETIIEMAGTMAFAISGIRLASSKQFDLFGAYVVGLATAIGGGTIRDLMLDATPFWMLNSSYFIITGLSLVIVMLLGKNLTHLSNTFFIFDTIGLALFTVVGIEKTLAVGYPFWVAIIMGTITGSFGGVLRDMLINEVPLIFREDIYALSCVIGGLCFALTTQLEFGSLAITLISAGSIIITRLVAVKYHLSLPKLNG